MQQEVDEVLRLEQRADRYTAILEYELPLDSRRPDVIILAKAAIVVLELKGKRQPSQADLDQVAAYARDLRCYHAACDGREVVPICVPMQAQGYVDVQGGIIVAGPDAIDGIIHRLQEDPGQVPVEPADFLSADAYRPLPTLVQAARELSNNHDIRVIRRARAATDPAVETITGIIHEAARDQSRHLVLLTGVPGAGKTLVGLRVVHANYLDDLAVARGDGRPSAPAVFLSGNGPLVQVLQYELRGGGGGGATFVRGVRDYLRTWVRRKESPPPEHVVVFDEAQRAFDADQVAETHGADPGFEEGMTEPEYMVSIAERIPQWCVLIGLIGSGQEIHVGEEGGLSQWRDAVTKTGKPDRWHVHGPEALAKTFGEGGVGYRASESLSLDTEIRYHLAVKVAQFVEQLLEGVEAIRNCAIASELEEDGYHLRLT